MKIYRIQSGVLVQHQQQFYYQSTDWDTLINRAGLYQVMAAQLPQWEQIGDGVARIGRELLPPIGQQEVWASGVTYYRSRDARMEESKEAGGDSFYDRVYDAERPELFFKATAARVVGHQQAVRIRRDSSWNVPEPELTLLVSSSGDIVGYTIGNDMSSRSIEGENPLYLPQAKTYDQSAGLGPGILVLPHALPTDTTIRLLIERGGTTVFSEQTSVNQIKRSFEELTSYLFRECSFPHGCFLMTGTGIIPDNSFTLAPGDIIHISIDGIGTLTNTVVQP